MNGQLWQECDKCGQEPVCVNCEYCKKHCRCGKPQQKIDSSAVDPYRRGIGAGFGPLDDGE